MKTLKITGADVWLGQSQGWRQVDVFCRDGLIDEIAPATTASADRVIDATGLKLIPGVIDPQVHFREPGNVYKEDLRTGSVACAAG